ncbi:MAG: 50S ribosome-binding GTPase [Spirochaetaceae bacterium]|nr:50S ribosome-binding GTPase [Spirochaetaceae bacterium]
MNKTTVAVVGNPNCGKTTLFNGLTGSTQHIGNWPGVTVEKKNREAPWGRLDRSCRSSGYLLIKRRQ